VTARHGAREIYTVTPDGRTATRLTVGGSSTNDVPSWSPDASRLAYQSVRGTDYEIQIVQRASRERSTLASSPSYEGLYAWSRDGSRLAFVSGRDGADRLYVVDADGRNLRRLTPDASLNPAWSP
jgi:TolB protein